MGQTRGYCLWLWIAAAAAVNAQTGLTIRVVEGDNAINSIRMHRAHDPVVQILDATGEPLHNATVSFLLPATGPSGNFGDSGLSLTVQTDERGMAAGRGLVPNRIEGPFRIRVTASAKGDSASATIAQTNAEPPAVSSKRSKWIVIAAVVGGAAVGGAVLASKGGGGNSSSVAGGTTGGTTGGSGSIVPGNPTFGPPR